MKKSQTYIWLILALLYAGIAKSQLPAIEGLPTKWQYVFNDPTVTPPSTSLYPEDFTLLPSGEVVFLHNIGLLEGSLVTALNSNGIPTSITSNRISNLGLRLAGVALEQTGQNGQLRILGQAMLNNNVLAIPPSGRLAISIIDNGATTQTIAPTLQQGGLFSRNDRGLPWVIRANNDQYFVVETNVTSNLETVAWIRTANGQTATASDTTSLLGRPQRNGQPVGDNFDVSRIRGLNKLDNGNFAFLYSQPGNYFDTSRVVVQLVFFDPQGVIYNKIDVSKAVGYAYHPEMVVADGNIYIYGVAAEAAFNTVGAPMSKIVAIGANGIINWEGSISYAQGAEIAFNQLCRLSNGQLLAASTYINAAGHSEYTFYRWTLGEETAQAIGTISFADSTLRAVTTQLFTNLEGDLIVGLQLEQFAGVPAPGQNPGKTYHAAIAIDEQNLGITSTKGIPALFDRVSIFPNPANDLITISGLPVGHDYTLDLIDATGRKVLSTTCAGGSQQLQVTHLPAGIYQLSIIENSGAAFRLGMVKK